MKSKIIRFLALSISLTLFFGCAAGGAGGDETYHIIATHSVDSFGSETQVEVYKGLASSVSGAEVTINGVALDENSLFGWAYYTGFGLSANNPGDTVTIKVVVGGTELMNETLTLPSDLVTIDTYNDPFDVGLSQTIEWSGGTGAQQFKPYISFGSTVSGDDYAPELASSVYSHTIPANIVEHDPDFDFFTLKVYAEKSMSLGGGLAPDSTFTVSTYDWVMPTTINP